MDELIIKFPAPGVSCRVQLVQLLCAFLQQVTLCLQGRVVGRLKEAVQWPICFKCADGFDEDSLIVNRPYSGRSVSSVLMALTKILLLSALFRARQWTSSLSTYPPLVFLAACS